MIIAERLAAVAREQAGDPVVAYMIAGTALEGIVRVLAAREGVRGQFSLRQNGTLRLRKVGEVKMPEVYPPRPEHQLRATLTLIRL